MYHAEPTSGRARRAAGLSSPVPPSLGHVDRQGHEAAAAASIWPAVCRCRAGLGGVGTPPTKLQGVQSSLD